MSKNRVYKKIYFCETAWTYEVGKTQTECWSHPDQCTHIGCGIIEVKVEYVRTIKKENLKLPSALIHFGQLKNRQLKRIREQILKLKNLYEYIKNQ